MPGECLVCTDWDMFKETSLGNASCAQIGTCLKRHAWGMPRVTDWDMFKETSLGNASCAQIGTCLKRHAWGMPRVHRLGHV